MAIMIESVFEIPWTTEQIELYQQTASGIDIIYTDVDRQPRSPTTIESETDRIFELFADRIHLDVNEDATTFVQRIVVPGDKAFGAPSISRVVEPSGEVVRTRFSGIFFIPRVANEALVSEHDGRILHDTYTKGSTPKNNLATRLNLYRKLRTIK